MAAKDTEPYIRACLDSVIAQTFEDWELIAVNDHSVDATPHILEEYSNRDPRIRVVHSKRRKLIPALKEGYKVSRGMLINRMDSDDLMPDYKLQVLYEHWQKHGKGHVVAGGTEHFSDEGELGDGFRRYDEWLNHVAATGAYHENIYKECVIPSHCWMIHREDFDNAGGFEPEVYPEDYDLCFRMYGQGLEFIGLDQILHHWRDRPQRISRTWDCYKDNRYFDLKLRYFLEIDRDSERPLVLWGAGRNGKDMAKLLVEKGIVFNWICENPKKTGKHIYDQLLHSPEFLRSLINPQIIITVAGEDEKNDIQHTLHEMDKQVVKDYWHFL